ncbi:MAG: hypothetical protein ACREUI_02130 [Burkholderiales bacterium]
MKLGKPQDNRVIVTIKASSRATEGKQKGKIVYETWKSFDLFETTSEEVEKVIVSALQAKAK